MRASPVIAAADGRMRPARAEIENKRGQDDQQAERWEESVSGPAKQHGNAGGSDRAEQQRPAATGNNQADTSQAGPESSAVVHQDLLAAFARSAG